MKIKKHIPLLILTLFPLLLVGQQCISGNCINGQGTETFLDEGKKYIGEWKDNQYDGKGVFFMVNGEIQSGTWLNNKFDKTWTIEAVSRFLKNKYPQFTGFHSEPSSPQTVNPTFVEFI